MPTPGALRGGSSGQPAPAWPTLGGASRRTERTIGVRTHRQACEQRKATSSAAAPATVVHASKHGTDEPDAGSSLSAAGGTSTSRWMDRRN
jgi:hypothetical protein